jgi:hypothetical protein
MSQSLLYLTDRAIRAIGLDKSNAIATFLGLSEVRLTLSDVNYSTAVERASSSLAYGTGTSTL